MCAYQSSVQCACGGASLIELVQGSAALVMPRQHGNSQCWNQSNGTRNEDAHPGLHLRHTEVSSARAGAAQREMQDMQRHRTMYAS